MCHDGLSIRHLGFGASIFHSRPLQNPITNSLEYGGDQQWVAVRAFLAENGGKREVCVSVEDRGIGI
jgi:signal transduction histidine kinase